MGMVLLFPTTTSVRGRFIRVALALVLGATLSAASLAPLAATENDPCSPLDAIGVVCEAVSVAVRRIPVANGVVLRSDPVALRPGWLTVGCCVTSNAAEPAAFAVAVAREAAMTSQSDDSCLAAYFPSQVVIEASVAAGEAGAPIAALAGAPGMAQQETVELRAVVGRVPEPALCGGAEGTAAWSAPLEDAEIVGSGMVLFFQVDAVAE